MNAISKRALVGFAFLPVALVISLAPRVAFADLAETKKFSASEVLPIGWTDSRVI